MTNHSTIQDETNSFPMQESVVINNYSELLLRISDLKADKRMYEEELKNTYSNLLSTINLLSIFKGTPIKNDQSLGFVKLGVNGLIELIIDIAFGRRRSLKGYLSSILVSKFANTLINNNMSSIISVLSSLIHNTRKNESL